jgi:hypothetical protein
MKIESLNAMYHFYSGMLLMIMIGYLKTDTPHYAAGTRECTGESRRELISHCFVGVCSRNETTAR